MWGQSIVFISLLRLIPYTYGEEAWILDGEACRVLNGFNAYMPTHITGNNRHYEASPDTTVTFNLLLWIRARRFR